MPIRISLPTLSRALLIAISCVPFAVGIAHAQLRPLDPTDLRTLSGQPFRIQIGFGWFNDQHASLAGTKGRLLEVGDIRAAWRNGRVVVEVGGTVQRFFRDDSRVQPAAEGVQGPDADGNRHDAGDYRVQTVVRLSADSASLILLLRFGTRLPTTNNLVGLERDQTDFFATIGAARGFGRLHVSAEAGVGVHGTRVLTYEQADVMVYAATLEYAGLFSPYVALVGQQDFHDWKFRGNEDLGEFRGGIRFGRRQWINAMFVRGYHDSSPSTGYVVSAGFGFGNY